MNNDGPWPLPHDHSDPKRTSLYAYEVMGAFYRVVGNLIYRNERNDSNFWLPADPDAGGLRSA